ncbi:roundabout homolog 3 isoform X11 [Carettochelys insculpta]|uniref:roundabout homolog 3 isoform X11 n=1 Tax=Carettochelys insculpta TaxID=44489 RepID=UPI003EB99C83
MRLGQAGAMRRLLSLRTLLYLVPALLGPTLGSRPRLEDASPRIVEHPSDLIVSKGEPATLNCKAEGRPAPTIEWYKDGERVETDREDPRSHRMLLPSGSLFFLRIVHGRRSKPDEGVYTCVARNYLGEAVSHNASLEVAILRDDFRQVPGDVVVAAGEPAVLECVPPRGHPEPTISWKKDGVRISDKDERVTIRGGKLMMSHARKSDAGTYVCVATNMVGERDSEPAQLVVFERPTFLRRPTNQVVLAEDTVDFHCEVQGDPVPMARWRKEEGELPRGRAEIQSNNSLRLSRVGAEDEGTYTCVAENSVGKSEASGSLSVHVPPQLVTRPRDQIVAQGRTVTFQCETRGNPPPAVFWQKEGSQILLFPSQPPQPTGRFSVSPSGEMTITEVQTADSGYYMCQAISVAGSILAKALLEVEDVTSDRVPPIIRRGPVNQTLPVDATAQLQCQVSGNPLPSLQWLKDGQPVVGRDPRISLADTGTLQITSLQVTDAGLYVCVATSSTGESTWSGALAVQEPGADLQGQPPEPGQLPGPPSAPLVTDVSRSSVTLAWKPSPTSGDAAATTYIIEAFSQSMGRTWQTVADDVRLEKHTVRGLNPNTIYLFLIRAANAHGLSEPSPVSAPVRTQDVSPARQGVDPRQVQQELGQVVVQLQAPVILSSTAIQVSWTVSRQAQFLQGYRVLYRLRGGAWQVQDVPAAAQQSTVLRELRPGREYELKLRPYFDEFQGPDSEVLAVRMPEAAPSAPPQAVSVVIVANSSSVRVSWEPPPPGEQNGIIQSYWVWCLGNESRFHINCSVEGTARAWLLQGLVPGVLYHTQVAAATGAGVGVRSPPVAVRIGEWDPAKPCTSLPRPLQLGWAAPSEGHQVLQRGGGSARRSAGRAGACWGAAAAPQHAPKGPAGIAAEGLVGRRCQPRPLPPSRRTDATHCLVSALAPAAEPTLEQGSVPVSSGEGVSLAEQITDVLKRPAFIAGIGGACWLVLMGFSLWAYWRCKRRKELSQCTASFAYVPAVPFPSAQGPARGRSRPGVLAMAPSASSYPWLADSWPAPNLLHNGSAKEPPISCCPGSCNAVERYYNEAGISNYLAQTDTYGAGASDGPIYSTIDPGSDEMRSFSQHSTPNGAPGLPTPSEESPASPWPSPACSQYALPGRSRPEHVLKTGKAKSLGKAVKTPALDWAELLPPPPPASELSQYGDEEEEELAASGEVREWGLPLPECIYLMENSQEEQCPPPPSRGDAASPAHSYGQQSTATLTPSPHDDTRAAEDIPRLHHFEVPHLAWRLPSSSGMLPRAASPPLTQSDPNLTALGEGNNGLTPRAGHSGPLCPTPAHSAENISPPSPGKACPAPSNVSLAPAHKMRAKKKAKASPYRREKQQGDLPPPPLPPPSEDPGTCSQPPVPRPVCSTSYLERDPGGAGGTERRAGHRAAPGQHQRQHRDGNVTTPGLPEGHRWLAAPRQAGAGSQSAAGQVQARGWSPQASGRHSLPATHRPGPWGAACYMCPWALPAGRWGTEQGWVHCGSLAEHSRSRRCLQPAPWGRHGAGGPCPGAVGAGYADDERPGGHELWAPELRSVAWPPPMLRTLRAPAGQLLSGGRRRCNPAPPAPSLAAEIVPYSRPTFLPRGHVSSHCSTTSSASSWGHRPGHSRPAGDRTEVSDRPGLRKPVGASL